jgi:hypothetical protein
MPTSCIAIDIDGTIVDVSDRLVYAVRELGYKVTSADDADKLARRLAGKDEDKFYKYFNNDGAARRFDEIKYPVLEQIKKVYEEIELPGVVVSGRPGNMTTTWEVIRTLSDYIHVLDVLVTDTGVRAPTDLYKVSVLKEKGYEPAAIFDDDMRVLAAVKSAFPRCRLYYVDGNSVTLLGK